MMNFDLTRDYRLTKKARIHLARPTGTLLEGKIEENIEKTELWFKRAVESRDFRIITVGDVVSEGLLSSDYLNPHIKMILIDGKTKRQNFKGEKSKKRSELIPKAIVNPAGLLKGDAMEKLKELLEVDGRYEVLVEGEEDLLVLPLVLMCSKKDYIIYGQPPITDAGGDIPAGLVIIPCIDTMKKKNMELLGLFEKD